MDNYFQIFYQYNLKYVTGNCPKGIIKLFNKEIANRKYIFYNIESGWNLEYKIAIYQFKNDKFNLVNSDYDDNFWKKVLFQKQNNYCNIIS